MKKERTGTLASKLSRIFSFGNKELIHFLHIGKNAGTEITRYIQHLNKNYSDFYIKKHGHHINLNDIPNNDRYFFSIRDPITRFVSGFYSRKRHGMPRHYSEWTVYEDISFQNFEHANDLAESLFLPNETGSKAFGAIKSISHNAKNQADWFCKSGNFFILRPPVHIVRQEQFDKDIATLFSKIGIEKRIVIEQDLVKSHKNDYSRIPPLSSLATANLNRWYSQDLEFYRQCCDWIETNK